MQGCVVWVDCQPLLYSPEHQQGLALSVVNLKSKQVSIYVAGGKLEKRLEELDSFLKRVLRPCKFFWDQFVFGRTVQLFVVLLLVLVVKLLPLLVLLRGSLFLFCLALRLLCLVLQLLQFARIQVCCIFVAVLVCVLEWSVIEPQVGFDRNCSSFFRRTCVSAADSRDGVGR